MSDYQPPSDLADVRIRGKESAFLVFSTLAGDVVRVAAALNVREADVERMAEEGKWREKLKAIIDLKNSSDPATVERSINRAIAFSQFYRYRLFLDRVITRLEMMENKEFESYLLSDVYDPKTNTTKSVINGRPLADIAKALETCNAMIAQTLCDTAQDRNRREELDGGSREARGTLHAAIAKAMQELADVKTPSQLLDEAQLASAAVLAERVKVTVTEKPYDKGD